MKIALVTGASSGLGREFVHQLAAKNDVDEFWIIARRREQLEQLASEISVPCRIVPLDLCDPAAFETLENLLKQHKPEIHWLVCSAGRGIIGQIASMDRHQVDAMIELNVRALADVTALALPYCTKGSGIIEIGSIAGFQPMPNFGIYGATKAFVESYTKALHHDLLFSGIRVTCACPYWVKDTGFIPLAKKEETSTHYVHPFLASHSSSVVRLSLWANNCNFWVATPGIITTLQRFLAWIVPDWIIVPFMELVSRL